MTMACWHLPTYAGATRDAVDPPGDQGSSRSPTRVDRLLTERFGIDALLEAQMRYAGRRPRLMSASLLDTLAGFVTATFVAAVVHDEEELRGCIVRHCGRAVAAAAGVREGFDQYEAVASWLVSEKTADLLAAAAVQPVGDEFRGLLVVLRQRVVA
jgi:hypothetical protein